VIMFPVNPIMFRKNREVSFVWNELSEHMVVSVSTMLISDDHLFISGDIKLGESPRTCVSGSGVYKCEYRDIIFRFYVRYCEPIGDNKWLFYLDHERNRRTREDPPGLSN